MSRLNVDSLHKHQSGLSNNPDSPKQQSDDVHFPEEEVGWHGYIEWEKYPDKAKRAAEILAKHQFAGVSPLTVDNIILELIKIVSYSSPNSNYSRYQTRTLY